MTYPPHPNTPSLNPRWSWTKPFNNLIRYPIKYAWLLLNHQKVVNHFLPSIQHVGIIFPTGIKNTEADMCKTLHGFTSGLNFYLPAYQPHLILLDFSAPSTSPGGEWWWNSERWHSTKHGRQDFFPGGFRVFSSLLKMCFFQSANKRLAVVAVLKLVGCKGTTWKFVVIWNSPTCWTPRTTQHLRAAAAHQASIVQSSALRASLISRKKN